MTDKAIRIGRFYKHSTFGVLKIVGAWQEGDHKVYDSNKPNDVCNYNIMAYELTEEATKEEWQNQTANPLT